MPILLYSPAAASLLCLILIIIGLISLTNAPTQTIDRYSAANLHEIISTHYDMDLALDLEHESLGGKVTHTFRCISNGVTRVVLDTRDLTIEEVYEGTNPNSKYSFKVYPFNYITGEVNHQLVINLGKSLNYGDVISVTIKYKAAQWATAVNWVPAEQTLGKKLKFMYTQCEAIECRSIVPLQDSPSVKSTFTAKLRINKQYKALASAVLVDAKPEGEDIIYTYEQKIPVPSYLLALAAGNIEKNSTGRRGSVYAEPEILKEASSELIEMDGFLDTIEGVLTPYVWGNYSVIIMPPSFPFGGMENPYLTFVSPSIIVGDRSAANVVAHEICHSWFGNQLTGKNWSHFWLNEGFTVYAERTIARLMHGEERFISQSRIGVDNLRDVITQFLDKKNPECTKLFPNIYRSGPDDIMSNVAYEKGYLFLRYLEKKIDLDHFYGFLRVYLSTLSFRSVEVWDMKAIFETYVREHLGDDAEKILQSIEWHRWLMEPGMPKPEESDYTNEEIEKALKLADYYIEKEESPKDNPYKNFDLDLRVIFMRRLLRPITGKSITLKAIKAIDTDNHVTKEETNPEVQVLWFRMSINQKYKDIDGKIEEFLGKIGRQKYIVPLYTAYIQNKDPIAKTLYTKFKSHYHPVAQRAIDKQFNDNPY